METIEKAIGILEGKLTEFKAKTTGEVKEEVTKMETMLTTLKETEVKAMNTKLIEQGATLEQLQGEIKELKAKRTRPGSQGVESRPSIMREISNFILEKKEGLIACERGGNFTERLEVKAPGPVLSTSLASGSYIDYLDWRPGMEPTGQFRFRELVRTVASAFDTVYYPQANKPVGQGSFGRQASEGATKAQVDRGYTMQTLNLTPMAAYIQCSRQSLRNIPFLQTWLPTSLNEQLLDTEDLDFVNTLVSAATGNTTTTGITVAAERMIYFIKNARQAKYVPTGIAVDPAVWAEILVTKPQNYSMPLGYAVDLNGMIRVLGTPIYPVNWLTGGRIICGDWTKTAIVESESLTFRQSDNVASTFIQNEITFLLERTTGLAVYRGDAFQTTVVS